MTVRKRKGTGSWVCDFYYNGERIVKTLKFASNRKEAEQAEAVIMNQVFKQAYGLAAKPDKLFENFVIEDFLPYSEANKKSFKCDVLICRVLIKAFKGRKLRQITPAMIEAFKQAYLAKPIVFGPKDAKKERKRSNATVNYHLSILSKILSMAVDAELLETNPAFKVKKLKINNQRLRVLSGEEEKALFERLGDNQLTKDIVTVALHTGMRRGEIFNLKWFDIDFERSVIRVQESKSNKKRMVPMNNTVSEMLRSVVRVSEFVFPSPKTGNRLDNIRTSFERAVSDAKIEDFRFHDLRHTFATRAADAGADVFTLMKLLGHSDIRMTSRYTHATDTAVRRAVEKLDVKNGFGDKSVTNGNGQQEAGRKLLKTLVETRGIEPLTS